MPTLVHLSYSPWSENARWALDHYGVEHRRVEHVPMIGEPLLRLVARRPFRRVTVPMLLDGPRVLADSWSIARRAEELGSGPTLFAAEHLDEIGLLVARIDAAMAAARARLTVRAVNDDGMLAESLPPFFIGPTRRMAVPLARQGARFILRKYHGREHDLAAAEATVIAMLDSLDEAIDDGPIFGSFSFADIVACGLLQFVEPVADAWVPLGPATRAVWTDDALRDRYARLVAWRDGIYDAYRSRGA